MDDDYSCFCEWTEGEPPEWFHVHLWTARQEHVCCECGETIKRGEKFEYSSGKWEGKIKAYKTCAYCAALRDRLYDKVEGIAFGDLACVAMAYPEIEP